MYIVAKLASWYKRASVKVQLGMLYVLGPCELGSVLLRFEHMKRRRFNKLIEALKSITTESQSCRPVTPKS